MESSGQGTSSSNTSPVNTLELKVRCSECWTPTPEHRTCTKNTQGCTYSDINVKCYKHELYLCQYSIWCYICTENITGTPLDTHNTQAHGDVIHKAGTVCTVSSVAGKKWLIIDCDFGRAMCEYWLRDSFRVSPTVLDFVLQLYTPLPSAQLYKYRCTVELSNPDTGHTITPIAAVQYTKHEDWVVCIPRSDYNACVHNEKVYLKINITKIENPSELMI